MIARRCGFASWARLKRHVAVLRRYSRFPERITASDDADTFLRLACLNYADDAPARWAQARHDPAISLDATLQSARLLPAAGADPNDGQALYSRMFQPGNDHPELLFRPGHRRRRTLAPPA